MVARLTPSFGTLTLHPKAEEEKYDTGHQEKDYIP